MEEIKIGEYIRIKGMIAKICNENLDAYLLDKEVNTEFTGTIRTNCLWKDKLNRENIKHSFNIIDLIQEGDYVNGYPVIEKTKTNLGENAIRILVYRNHCTDFWETIFENEIKDMVTKEQYDSVKYVVEE